jgi:hypothetical protein
MTIEQSCSTCKFIETCAKKEYCEGCWLPSYQELYSLYQKGTIVKSTHVYKMGDTAAINVKQTECISKLKQFIEENCTIDDCGFDPKAETKPTLVSMMNNLDIKARKILKEIP